MNYKYVLFGSLETLQIECPRCHTWQFQDEFCDCGESLNKPLKRQKRTEIRISSQATREPYKKGDRRRVYKRDNYICQYCGNLCSESDISIDHIIPASMGGSSRMDNLITCCLLCNRIKNGKVFNSIEEIKEYIRNAREKR